MRVVRSPRRAQGIRTSLLRRRMSRRINECNRLTTERLARHIDVTVRQRSYRSLWSVHLFFRTHDSLLGLPLSTTAILYL